MRATPAAKRVACTTMPTSWGPLRVVAFRADVGDIVAVVSGLGDGRRVPVRVHDACLTGETFGSLKCDCGLQLRLALEVQTRQKLGVVIYTPQEGRGIGLANKIAAYQLQEVHGLDTVDANLALGLPAEMRDYSAVRYILEDLGVESVLLMTNNPFKVKQLRATGVSIEGMLPIVAPPSAQVTSDYLETKRRRMGHMLPHNGEWLSLPEELAGPASELLSRLRREVAERRLLAGDRPFTLLSFATSMDGFIAGLRPGGHANLRGGMQPYPVALSGQAAHLLTHHLRGCTDVILVGIGTVLTDNPRLDVRAAGAGASPRPVVLDSHLRLPPQCQLLSHRPAGGRLPTLVLCTEDGPDSPELAAKASRAAALEAAGAVVVPCQADDRGRVHLQDALQKLRSLGIGSVMVEGGAEVIASLLRRSDLVDRVVVTQAPTILGQGVPWAAAGAARLAEVESFMLGCDAIFTGRLSSPQGTSAT